MDTSCPVPLGSGGGAIADYTTAQRNDVVAQQAIEMETAGAVVATTTVNVSATAAPRDVCACGNVGTDGNNDEEIMHDCAMVAPTLSAPANSANSSLLVTDRLAAADLNSSAQCVSARRAECSTSAAAGASKSSTPERGHKAKRRRRKPSKMNHKKIGGSGIGGGTISGSWRYQMTSEKPRRPAALLRSCSLTVRSSLVPYNTNVFLMEEHEPQPANSRQQQTRTRDSSFSVDDNTTEDDQLHQQQLEPEQAEQPENEEEFLSKEFSSVYEDARSERLDSMSKAQLVREYLQIEANYDKLSRHLRPTTNSEAAQVRREEHKRIASREERDTKMLALEERVRQLVHENGELRRQMADIRNRSRYDCRSASNHHGGHHHHHHHQNHNNKPSNCNGNIGGGINTNTVPASSSVANASAGIPNAASNHSVVVRKHRDPPNGVGRVQRARRATEAHQQVTVETGSTNMPTTNGKLNSGTSSSSSSSSASSSTSSSSSADSDSDSTGDSTTSGTGSSLSDHNTGQKLVGVGAAEQRP